MDTLSRPLSTSSSPGEFHKVVRKGCFFNNVTGGEVEHGAMTDGGTNASAGDGNIKLPAKMINNPATTSSGLRLLLALSYSPDDILLNGGAAGYDKLG